MLPSHWSNHLTCIAHAALNQPSTAVNLQMLYQVFFVSLAVAMSMDATRKDAILDARAEASPQVDRVGAARLVMDRVGGISMNAEESEPHETNASPDALPDDNASENCPLIDAVPFQLNREAWWRCNAESDGLVCFNLVLHQTRLNLRQDTCTNNPCYAKHLPNQILNLHRLARTVHDFGRHLTNMRAELGNGANCPVVAFNQAMELYANVLLQKSQQCHLDFDVLQHLSAILHHRADEEGECHLQEHLEPHQAMAKEDEDYFAQGGHFFYGMAVDGMPRGFFFPETNSQPLNYTMDDYQGHLDQMTAAYDRLLALAQ